MVIVTACTEAVPPAARVVYPDWRISGCRRLQYREPFLGPRPYLSAPKPARCLREVDAPRVYLRAEPGAWVELRGPETRSFAPWPGEEGWQAASIPGDGLWTVKTSLPDFHLTIEVFAAPLGEPERGASLSEIRRWPGDPLADARALLGTAHPAGSVLDSLDLSTRGHLAMDAAHRLLFEGRPDQAAVAFEVAGFLRSRDGDRSALIRETFSPRVPPLRWLEGQWAAHKRRAGVALAYLWRPELAYREAHRALELARLMDHPRYEALSALRATSAALQAGLDLEGDVVESTMRLAKEGRLSACTSLIVHQTLGWLKWLAEIRALGSEGEALESLPDASTLLETGDTLGCRGRFDPVEARINRALAAGLNRRSVELAKAVAWLEREAPGRAEPWLELARALIRPSARRVAALEALDSEELGVAWYKWRILATLFEKEDPEVSLRALYEARDLAEQPGANDPFLDRAWMAWRVGESIVRLLLDLDRPVEAYAAARRHLRHSHARTVRRWGDPGRAEALLQGAFSSSSPEQARLLVGRFDGRAVAFLELTGELRAIELSQATLSEAAKALPELRELSALRVLWTPSAALSGLEGLGRPEGEEAPNLGWSLDLPPLESPGVAGHELTTVIDVEALERSSQPAALRLAGRGQPAIFHPREIWKKAPSLLFLGHGTSGTEGVEMGLRYADRTILPSDIYEAQPVATQVGVFACSPRTSRSRAPRDEIPRALILAGAQEVVAARGWVPEKEALELAEAWVDALEHGHSPAWIMAQRTGLEGSRNFELWTR